MDVDTIAGYIGTFEGIQVLQAYGARFYIYDPHGDAPQDRWLPFATIVMDDSFDLVSDLGHPDSYRLNIGLTKQTYTQRFGRAPTERDEDGVLVTGYDYAARDRLVPHPHYANQHWVSIVDPGPGSESDVRHLLAEAYDFAVRKHVNVRARQAGPPAGN